MTPILKSLIHSLRADLEMKAAAVTDAQLLERYVQNRDSLAFDLLFWRHAPMVYGVCNRLLPNPAEAEDACQAVFVILSRKANILHRGSNLAGWLHRIAYRVAFNVRRGQKRRSSHEQKAARSEVIHCDPLQAAISREILQILDAEITRLPSRYRDPLVLCELEGRSREAAACELKIPVGTLDSRLSRARERLRTRLKVVALPSLLASTIPNTINASAILAPALSSTVLPLAGGVGALAFKKSLAFIAASVLLVSGTVYNTLNSQQPEKEKPSEKAVQKPLEMPPEKNYIDPEGAPLPPGALVRLGTQRFRHAGEVVALAYSPDSKMLASASLDPKDSTVRIWDSEKGKELLRIQQPSEPRSQGVLSSKEISLGFSQDNKKLFIADQKAIRIWNIEEQKEIANFDLRLDPKLSHRLVAVKITPNGKNAIYIWQNESIELRSLTDGKVIHRVATITDSREIELAFTTKGDRFVFAGKPDKSIQIFEVATLRNIGTIPAPVDSLYRVRFLDDGQNLVLLTGRNENFVRNVEIIDIHSKKMLRSAKVDTYASCIDVSPDGKLIVVGNGQGNFIEIVDAVSLNKIGRLHSFHYQQDLVFSPNGSSLTGIIFGSSTISLWDLSTRNYLPNSPEQRDFFESLFSSDGKSLILTRSHFLTSIDWRTGKTISRTKEPNYEFGASITYSADCKLKVFNKQMDKSSSQSPNTLLIAEASTGKVLHELVGHKDYPFQKSFSADGSRLATGGLDKAIFIWDVKSGKQIAHFTPDQLNGFEKFLLSNDGRKLITNRYQENQKHYEISVWDVENTKKILAITDPTLIYRQLAISPGGSYLACNSASTNPASSEGNSNPCSVTIWSLAKGERFQTLPSHSQLFGNPGIWIGFSPNGKLLATGDADGHLRLWEVATGKEMFAFEGHKTSVSGNFSPDGKLLVAASEDAPCYIWEVIPTQPLKCDPEQSFKDLGDEDAKKAFQAIRALASNPNLALEVIRKNLKPLPAPDPKQVENWIKDLDSNRFAAREKATAELVKIADRIPKELSKAEQIVGVEGRGRLKTILESIGTPSPEYLKQLRAVQVFDYIGTPEAKKLAETFR
ncbi:sigma-70 family RNA polymerase sigma factor [Telmatocola sphagniphila]|uniref:Sigma-70 family RNA polymerase sigma factor n=1 Tax=Telmatocola sphagniphila TaxID=1123043 RepID=A0A8E6B403_9BACT|nr:sigma-70 family RNA polymerase sigma factor [Telmatocola sphagniphila]QVL31467.1 sigma-70 family RNA polymerase sigma factor [Telmatocola sphagniphila]